MNRSMASLLFLAAFARAGIADAESADAREVNDLTFTSDENPDAFNDVF